MLKALSGVFLLLTITYLTTGLLLTLFQNRLIYFPSPSLHATPGTIGLQYEDVELRSTNGTSIHGWFIPASNATDTLLFFHGNAGNIADRLSAIQQFHTMGVNVLIIDYQGYGKSDGRATESGSYDDARAAWAYLTKDKNIAPDHIIVFGRSLGGAIAAQLATEVRPKAVILESTFRSVYQMARPTFRWWPIKWLLRTRYDTESKVSQIKSPLLLIHSPDDEMIPYSHSQALYDRANEPKQFLKISGGHNEGYRSSEPEYSMKITRFLTGL